MPRTKLYETDQQRHAAYRQRTAKSAQEVKNLQKIASGEKEAPTIKGVRWYTVELIFDREGLPHPVTTRHIMEEEHYLRLQAELHNWRRDPSHAPKHGTYAFGGTGEDSHLSGMVTLMFTGITMKSASLIENYEPDPCYSISEGAVRLILGYPSYQSE